MTTPKPATNHLVDPDLTNLRQTWTSLYKTTLPHLARTKSPTQPVWPVTLDHCFARIILDNTVGGGTQQWDKVIAKPAVRNMSAMQLRDAIEMGERIKAGDVDLVELDRVSLEVRGKNEGKYGDKKRKRNDGDEVEEGEENALKKKRADEQSRAVSKATAKKMKKDDKQQSTLVFTSMDGKDWDQLPSPATSASADQEHDDKQQDDRSHLEKKLDVTSDLSREQIVDTLRKIQTHQTLTPFRRRLYISLLSVPKGSYTTYAALATHLGSAARAVGNGMRNNPFAPDVPCHRVLASDGTLGGFGGEWGRDGKYRGKQESKVKLLGTEGVKFDSKGKVKGPVWKGFWDLEDFEREYGEIL
ncbi:hypothetical protein OHC33_001244 [Knufia fluminis]|uniref:Methylated-DNA--protein-cysteine methyltransferase n=1 Tax=Knufia fluminis TaxID=191047 RepID=A0AAN8I8X5_9EURO|nr:hypothetical protein OHC33_001244 [Knufia fluminis]